MSAFLANKYFHEARLSFRENSCYQKTLRGDSAAKMAFLVGALLAHYRGRLFPKKTFREKNTQVLFISNHKSRKFARKVENEKSQLL